MIKKEYFASLLIALTSFNKCAIAQCCTIPRRLMEVDLPVAWMENNLGLRADQRAAIARVNIKYAERLDSIRSSNVNRFIKFQQAYHVMWARDNELKFILTESQFISYMNAKEWEKYPFLLQQ